MGFMSCAARYTTATEIYELMNKARHAFVDRCVDRKSKQEETLSGLGPIWAHMGPYGPLWAHMGPCGPLWAIRAHMGPILFKQSLVLIKKNHQIINKNIEVVKLEILKVKTRFWNKDLSSLDSIN